MADMITLVIVGIFGLLALLLVMGFYVIQQRNGGSRFERHDYYKSYKSSGEYARGGNPFKAGPMAQSQKEQRMITLAIAGVAILALLVSIFFDVFEGLLIIFLLPVVVRFIRARNEANSRRNASPDGNRSSY